jgi:hypothetical protein
VHSGILDELPQPLELITQYNPSGYALFFGPARPPAGAQITLPQGLFDQTNPPAQPGVARVRSAFYQEQEVVLSHQPNVVLPPGRNIVLPDQQAATVPASVFSCDLFPGYAYPFPYDSTLTGGRGPTLVRGSVYRADGSGIAQTKVEVTAPAVNPTPVYWTDETGQWVLPFPDTQPSGAITIQLTVPDGTAAGKVIAVPGVALVQGAVASLRQTALRGSVVDRNSAAIGNVTVTISARVGRRQTTFPDSVTTASDGSWAYYFDLNQPQQTASITATLPDGRTKQVQAGIQVQPQQTVTVPTIRFA